MEDEESKSKMQADESGFCHYRSAIDWRIGGVHDFDGIVVGANNEGAVKGDNEEVAYVEPLQRQCGLVVLLQVEDAMRDDEVLRAMRGFGGYEGSGEIKWIYKVGCWVELWVVREMSMRGRLDRETWAWFYKGFTWKVGEIVVSSAFTSLSTMSPLFIKQQACIFHGMGRIWSSWMRA